MKYFENMKKLFNLKLMTDLNPVKQMMENETGGNWGMLADLHTRLDFRTKLSFFLSRD